MQSIIETTIFQTFGAYVTILSLLGWLKLHIKWFPSLLSKTRSWWALHPLMPSSVICEEEVFGLACLTFKILIKLPWIFIGDFNAISGAHEHKGKCAPNKPQFIDFQVWHSQNSLVDLRTKGSQFTWYNGRAGTGYVGRRLGRVFYTQD